MKLGLPRVLVKALLFFIVLSQPTPGGVDKKFRYPHFFDSLHHCEELVKQEGLLGKVKSEPALCHDRKSHEVLTVVPENYPKRWEELVFLLDEAQKNYSKLGGFKVSERLFQVKALMTDEEFTRFMDTLSEGTAELQYRFVDRMNILSVDELSHEMKAIGAAHCDDPFYVDEKVCLTVKIGDILDHYLSQYSQKRVYDAIGAAEKNLGRMFDRRKVRILSREINPASFRWLEMGFGSKPLALKAKTAKSGVIAGLIPVDQSLSKAKNEEREKYENNIQLGISKKELKAIHLERDGLIAVRDDTGRQFWEKVSDFPRGDEKEIKVVATPGEVPFTADNDVALVAYTKEKIRDSEKSISEGERTGVRSGLDRKVQEQVNEAYRNSALPGTLSTEAFKNEIVNHGPETRNPDVNPPDYPWIDSSGHKIEAGPKNDPHQNLRQLLEDLNADGLEYYIPDSWRTLLWPDSQLRRSSH